MNDQMWTALGDEVAPEWTPEREGAVRAAIARRATRRRAVLRTAVVVASTGFIAVGGVALVSWRSAVPVSAPLVSGASAAFRAPAARGEIGIETVTVTQLSPDTALAPLPDLDGRGFALRAGGARFSVPHDTRHPFIVLAGDVTIEDLGTTFTVRYLAADRLNIAVPACAATSIVRTVSPLAEASPKPQRPAGVVASSWRPLAERGQYEEAQKALRKAGPSAVRDDTADLLLAADAARLSGHPAEAVPYLERVLRGHTHDPRAGLAAILEVNSSRVR